MELIVRAAEREERVRVERDGTDHVVEVGGAVYRVHSAATGAHGRSLLVDGRQHEVTVRRIVAGRYEVGIGGLSQEVEVLDPLAYLAREAGAERGGGGAYRVGASIPGRVVAVLVTEGQTVEAGQGLVVLEAMKMENEIVAERRGVVRKVHVQAGQAVEGGDPICDVE